MTCEPLEQEAASLAISQHSKPEQQHDTLSRGSTLLFQTTQDPERQPIAPIPVDYNRPPPPQTPSSSIERSTLKLPSPTYPNSINAIQTSKQHPHQKQNARLTEDSLRRVSQAANHERRIENWLEAADADAKFDRNVEDVDDSAVEGSFPIWSKDAVESPSVGRSALRDVTNLRQPGYLRRNSFWQDKKRG